MILEIFFKYVIYILNYIKFEKIFRIILLISNLFNKYKILNFTIFWYINLHKDLQLSIIILNIYWVWITFLFSNRNLESLIYPNIIFLFWENNSLTLKIIKKICIFEFYNSHCIWNKKKKNKEKDSSFHIFLFIIW